MAMSLAPIVLGVAQDQVPFRDPVPEDFAEFVADIQDPATPLPSCDTVGVSEILGCDALCTAVEGGGVDVGNTRDRNGDFVCSCNDLVACSDTPTCGQLVITPGTVEESCGALCGDRFLAFVDEVQYAGGAENAVKNRTTFFVECRCDGVTECKDNLLFSDLAAPVTCVSLGIEGAGSCGSYCESEGGGLFDVGVSFERVENDDGTFGTCVCRGTDTDGVEQEAQACTDVPIPEGPEACTLADPCPTPAPTVEGSAGAGIHTNAAAVVLLQGLLMGVSLAFL